MRKSLLTLLCLVCILPLISGCAGPAEVIEAELGEEFTLPIGDEAVITGEGLRISFEEVIEDSRCPKNVECVWAGQAKYTLLFTLGEASERAVLTEPGAGGKAKINVFDYEVKATLEPYPQDPGDIKEDDYRLQINVGKGPASALELEDQTDIYAAIIRQLYSSDHSFGSNPPAFPNLYIVYVTNDRAGADAQGPPSPKVLTEPLRTAIEEKLSDLPAKIFWVSSFGEVPLENNSGVKGGGAVINVGNIQEQEDGTAQVAGGIYVANLAASGRTYILEKQDGTWRITGDTGVIWIS